MIFIIEPIEGDYGGGGASTVVHQFQTSQNATTWLSNLVRGMSEEKARAAIEPLTVIDGEIKKAVMQRVVMEAAFRLDKIPHNFALSIGEPPR